MDEDRVERLDEPRVDAPVVPLPPRGRHAGPAVATGRSLLREPGLGLLLASVVLVVVVTLAAAVGWVALLFVVALLQVFLARSWVDYLEVPGELPVALAVVAAAAAADLGVVVAHLRADRFEAADQLVAVAPALGVVFLASVAAQLVRREREAGALAGLVTATTGGALAVGLAVWLPLEASPAGAGAVVVGVALCAAVACMVGVVGWVRRVDVPAPGLLLPVLLGLASGPVYVVARAVSG